MLEVDYPVKQKVAGQERFNENSGQKTLLERKKSFMKIDNKFY